MLAGRLGARYIRKNLALQLGIAFLYAMALSLWIATTSFTHFIQRELSNRAQGMLGADFLISARRPLLSEEERALQKVETAFANADLQKSVGREFYSMALTADTSRLVEVRAIDEAFPLRGALEFTDGSVRSDAQKTAEKFFSPLDREIWVSEAAAQLFEIKVGSTLTLLGQSFRVTHVYRSTGFESARGVRLAPSVMISLSTVGQMGLAAERSLFYYRTLYRCSQAKDVEAFSRAVEKALPDPSLKLLTAQASADESGKVFTYLIDFLAVASLCAFLLITAGFSFLTTVWVAEEKAILRIFKNLGLSPVSSGIYLATKLLFLGASATGAGAGLATLFFPWAERLFAENFSQTIHLHLSPAGFASAFFFFLVSIFISLAPHLKKWTWGLSAFLVAGLTFFLSHSVRTTGVFCLALIVILFLGAGLTAGLKKALPRFTAQSAIPVKLFTRFLVARHRLIRNLVASITFAVFATSLVPLIQKSLNEEWAFSPAKNPRLFLFDIQGEERSALRQWLESHGSAIRSEAPMVRARLVKKNDQPWAEAAARRGWVFWKTVSSSREDDEERRTKNRMYNLSYREGLGEGENQLAGRIPKNGEEMILEKKFADRLGVVVGDRLTFSIEGFEISAKIVGLKRVRWQSFNPNFFITFGVGALEEAPKTFLASLSIPNDAAKEIILKQLPRTFSNISVLDVEDTVESALHLMNQALRVIQVFGWIIFILSTLVVMGFIFQLIASQRAEIALFHRLGLRQMHLNTFLLLVLSAPLAISVIVGNGVALGVFVLFSQMGFEGLSVPSASFILRQIAIEGGVYGAVILVATPFLPRQKSSKV